MDIKFKIDRNILYCLIDDNPHHYEIMSFTRKPSDNDIEKIKKIVIRSMVIYHLNIKMPEIDIHEG